MGITFFYLYLLQRKYAIVSFNKIINIQPTFKKLTFIIVFSLYNDKVMSKIMAQNIR